MDNSGIGDTSLKNVLDRFIGTYAQRDRNTGFSDWLGDMLRRELPDMPAETGRKLAAEIMGAVAGYNRALEEVKRAAAAGQSKEEWFAERLKETYEGMPLGDVGEKLVQIENALDASNTQLMQEAGEMQTEGETIADADFIDWNEYSVKNRVDGIGQQIILSGMAVAANVVRNRVEGCEAAGTGDIVRETLQDGLKNDPDEVKAAVAGAVKVAAVRGLEEWVPDGTPTETICDIAGAAVESAEALFDAANGESTITEAMDRIGMAGIAAGGRCVSRLIKGGLAKIPVVGPVAVDLAGGLLDHLTGSEFAENVGNTIRSLAAATWKGIKESRTGKVVSTVFGGIKKIFG